VLGMRVVELFVLSAALNDDGCRSIIQKDCEERTTVGEKEKAGKKNEKEREADRQGKWGKPTNRQKPTQQKRKREI
jgi:hypothetical protein